MRFIRLKVLISLIILSISTLVWAQNSSGGNQTKPIYSKGCQAKNEKEAKGWWTILLYTYVESSARSKCGWNFDQREATDWQIIANTQVRLCWGDDFHKYLQSAYDNKAQELTNNCNSPEMQSLKSGYSKLNTK